MLPKKARNLKKNEIDLLKHSDFFFNNHLLTLLITKKSTNEETNFGIIVSLKVSKKAATRNLLKRRIYHAIEEKKQNIKPGYNCLFIVKKQVIGKSFGDLKKSATKLLMEAKIIKNKIKFDIIQ